MIQFIDGPANGISLSLSRAPIMLRVVHSITVIDRCWLTGVRERVIGWDALDQLTDVPKPDESIHLYRMCGECQWVHLDGRDPNTGKRWGRTDWCGEYVFVAIQPRDDEMRTTAAWHEWTTFNSERILAERKAELEKNDS